MVLEAFAAGLPVVALPSLGTDSRGRALVERHHGRDTTAEAFAAAVLDTVRRDQGDRIARGARHRRRLRLVRIGGRVLDVFQQAAGSPARRRACVRRPPPSMGAKARAWINRALVVLAIAAGVGLVLGLPGPSRRRRGSDSGGGGAAGRDRPFRGFRRSIRWAAFTGGCRSAPAPSPSMTDERGQPRAWSRFWGGIRSRRLLRAGRQRPPPSRGAAPAGCAGPHVAIHGVTHKKVHRDSQQRSSASSRPR